MWEALGCWILSGSRHLLLTLGTGIEDAVLPVWCSETGWRLQVPDCYRHSPARLQPGYLSKFQVDTLFYIFYSMPNDEAQVLAADELRSRGWLFHKEFKVGSLLLLSQSVTADLCPSQRTCPEVFSCVPGLLLATEPCVSCCWSSIPQNAILAVYKTLSGQHEQCRACVACDFDA